MTQTLDELAIEPVQTGQVWPWARLEDECEIILGQSPPGSTYRKSPEGLPFFQGKADFGEVNPIPSTWCVAPNKIAMSGDILISVRAPVGPTNIADRECCIGRGLAAIRCGEFVHRDFLHHYLKLLESKLASLGSGSTFSAITGRQLRSFTFPLPPLPEQKRIASILNEQMAAVEKAHKAAEERLEAAQALPAAYVRDIFPVGGEKEMPFGWEELELGELVELYDGKPHYRDTWAQSGIPIIRIQNLKDRHANFNYWDKSLDREVLVRNGDLLLAWSGTPGTSFGAHIWEGEMGVLNRHIFRLDFDERICDKSFLKIAINTRLERLIRIARGAVGIRHVTRKEVQSLSIPIPPFNEQIRIAEMLQERTILANRLESQIDQQINAIEILQPSILRSAFAGEL